MTKEQYKKLARSASPEDWVACFRWRMAQKAEGKRGHTWASLYGDLCGMPRTQEVWEIVRDCPGAMAGLRRVAERDIRDVGDTEWGKIARKAYSRDMLAGFLVEKPDLVYSDPAPGQYPRLKEFTTSGRWWEGLWGGGHTRQGWRARPVSKGSSTLLVGRPGVPGCFSAALVKGGTTVLVEIHDDRTPEQVAAAWRNPASQDAVYIACNAVYFRPEFVPGWGLAVLERLEKLQRG